MKTSINNNHASVALFNILNKKLNGPNNIIIKTFIDKKMSYPKMII